VDTPRQAQTTRREPLVDDFPFVILLLLVLVRYEQRAYVFSEVFDLKPTRRNSGMLPDS